MKNGKNISILMLSFLFSILNFSIVKGEETKKGVHEVRVDNQSSKKVWIAFMGEHHWIQGRADLEAGKPGIAKDNSRYKELIAAPGSEFHFGTNAGNLPLPEKLVYNKDINLSVKNPNIKEGYDKFVLRVWPDSSGNLNAKIIDAEK